MKTDTKIIFSALIASVAIIVGAAVVFGKDTSPKREQLGQATMAVNQTSQDLGSMKVSEEKTADFTITNIGDTTLRLWGVTTSCNCTFAKITIDGKTTGEFSMHAGALKNWIGEVAAGKTAIVTAIYRPSVMPVQGPVSRQVTFATNDPKNPEVTLSISATVQ